MASHSAKLLVAPPQFLARAGCPALPTNAMMRSDRDARIFTDEFEAGIRKHLLVSPCSDRSHLF
jgi:hypothetical protein